MFATRGGGSNASTNFLFTPWYGPGGQTYFDSTSPVKFGDVILGGTLDSDTLGHPSLAFHESCTGNQVVGYGIGINPDPYPYSVATGNRSPTPATGITQTGLLSSVGTSMFRPRVARDSSGFIDPSSSASTYRTWTTFVYYTPGAININANCNNDYKEVWKTNNQNFGVSEVVITEY